VTEHDGSVVGRNKTSLLWFAARPKRQLNDDDERADGRTDGRSVLAPEVSAGGRAAVPAIDNEHVVLQPAYTLHTSRVMDGAQLFDAEAKPVHALAVDDHDDF